MNQEERDEEMLREFLEGDSALSRLYRRDAHEEPNAQLDATILAEARRNLARTSRVAHSPFARHWVVPTSLAAVLVLSVSVVLLTPDPVRQPGIEMDGVAETPGAAGSLADAPKAAASGEEMPAPAGAPSLAKPAMDREQDSDAEDESTGGRASGLVPLQPPARQQRAHEPVAKSSEKRERKALRLKSVPSNEQQPRPAPATGAGVAEQAAAPSTSRARVESLAEPLAELPPGPHAMPADTVQADPEAWLRFIESLLKEQNPQAARSNLRAFRSRYPDLPLPAALMPLAASLDAERP